MKMSVAERKIVRVTSDDFDLEKKKKSSKIYKQHYRKEWEKLPDFKNWLRSVPGQPTKAFCLVCNKNLHAHRLTLMKHTCTAKHARRARDLVVKDVNRPTEERHYDEENYSGERDNLKSSIEQHSASENNEHDRSRRESDTVIVFLESGNKISTDKVNTNCDYSDNENEENRQEEEEERTLEITEDKATQTPAEEGDLADIDDSEVGLNENIGNANIPNSSIKIRKNLYPTQPPVTVNLYETGRGCPMAGVLIILYWLKEGRWVSVSERVTDPLGDCKDLIERRDFTIGRYKIHIDIGRYYEFRNTETSFPYIELVFDVKSENDHIYLPLLLNPFGYTTYRKASKPT